MSLGGNIFPWSDYRVVSTLALSIILSIFFYHAEIRAQSPVMPLDLVFQRPFANNLFVGFFTLLTVNSILFNLPLYFQAVLLESASKAGSRLLVPSIATTIGSTITGIFISQTGRVGPSLFIGSSLVIFGAVNFVLLRRGMPSLFYTAILIPANMGQGILMPSQYMSLLGITYHHEQAVVSSICFMWRSIGSVFGIAISSLIVQNGLVHYLEKYVTGEPTEKAEIIKLVRGSVTAVFKLDSVHQEEAIRAYESSLRWCFIFTLMTAVIVITMLFGIKMINLRDKEEDRVVERKSWRKVNHKEVAHAEEQ